MRAAVAIALVLSGCATARHAFEQACDNVDALGRVLNANLDADQQTAVYPYYAPLWGACFERAE